MDHSKRNLKCHDGLDDESRRLREDKNIQIRKIKRADRTVEYRRRNV